jgi:hypothetical protein
MRGDRVEAVVDTGAGVQTFEITATRAGRRVEVTTARGIVEVTEVTRGGTPIRTGRFMASRLVALVEHPAMEGDNVGVDVSTRRRISAGEETRPRRGRGAAAPEPAPRGRRRAEAEPIAMDLVTGEPEPVDLRAEAERRRERDEPS